MSGQHTFLSYGLPQTYGAAHREVAAEMDPSGEHRLFERCLICAYVGRHRETTAAEQVAARLDSYTQQQHVGRIKAARYRAQARRAARAQRARAAAARVTQSLRGETPC